MIIKKTAFCGGGSSCCPTITIDTEANTVTIVDDFEGTLTMERGLFLSANFFAKKLNEGKINIQGSVAFNKLEYSITIENVIKNAVIHNEQTKETKETDILVSQQYFIALEHKGQKVKDITLKQWNILADTVCKSYDPMAELVAETEALGLYELQEA